jgi:hypothetical protein
MDRGMVGDGGEERRPTRRGRMRPPGVECV